jgi:pimeloyl-ACP methyl ester carboxylesterase
MAGCHTPVISGRRWTRPSPRGAVADCRRALAIYAGRGSAIAEWDRGLAHGPSDVIEVWLEAEHFLHQEQPDRFAAAMRAWLGQLPDDRQLDEARP